MGADMVRVCPTCGVHHPADHLRCDCGALLFGVDLVRPERLDDNAGSGTKGSTTESLPREPVTPVVERTGTVHCPHDDCGQPNPAASLLCLYCNRPMGAVAAGLEGSAPVLLQLPSALRPRYRVLRAFEARGAEADILLVERAGSVGGASKPLVAKIYRQGIQPSAEVLARIARIDVRHRVDTLETGLSDGHAYEVMEYCALGSLRQAMEAKAPSATFITEVIHELAAALKAVHEAALVHRDLKPENVLLRSDQPLDLVLTDFSTASVMDATQRFTGMARTLLYAPPEALSGVLDAKADYWALGMVLLELATGAHPFRGLSEAVVLHHLTTRAMDVQGVTGKRLRQLVRGLLLRDPQRRWGAHEIERWLAGDESLADPVEQETLPGFTQPYAVLHERCTTPEQLAVAFARHWQAGVADLANGQLLKWFTEVQKDQNAVRLLLTLRYDSHLTGDEQLLRFILYFAPGIPPMWRGRGIELPALLTQASNALRGDEAATQWLSELYKHRVLHTYAAAGNAQVIELEERWSAASESFDAAWAAYVELLQKQKAREIGPAEVVMFDDVMYGRGPANQAVRPPLDALHPRFLAIAYDPAWTERLRASLARELTMLSAQCSWLTELGNPLAMMPAELLACEAVLPVARKAVERQARQEALRVQQEGEEREQLHAALQASLVQIGLHARKLTFLFPETNRLSGALEEYAEVLARIRARGATDVEWMAVRSKALRGEPAALRLRDLCDRLSEHRTANEGWFNEQAGTFVVIGLGASFALWNLQGFLLALSVVILVTAWRLLPILHMVQDIHRLGKELGISARR
ncbi:protein kinase domain-containing protein [Ottowia thiooxydans]|uniref:protein kinase domain-containing protein n=1 Tax=Ottowia thiooxydans TaxID=219182 RepID=UPI0003F96870|nr:protein kinase [Ottowia thiooxydans]